MMAAVIGQVVGNFRIVERLGKGGMGEVWLGEHREIKTRVAIKMLLPELSQDQSHVQRFFKEAIAAGKIKHAGIVKIFDVGFIADRAYLVMELLEGETLAARIRHTGRLPLAHVADLGTQLAGVLDAAHAAAIVHRDLKPDNIFLIVDSELSRGERVKVLDFGIAKLGQLTGTGPTAATGTSSMGTPTYMSPEQWRATAHVDGRADLYSLGCLLFEAVCGRPPFHASSIGEMCDQHLNAVPPRAKSLLATVPPELDDLLAGLLAKSPDDRPSTDDVRRVLARISRPEALGETLPETDAPQVPRRSRRRGWIAGGLVAIGAAAAGIVVLSGRTRHGEPGPCAGELASARDAAGLSAAAACLDRAGNLTEAASAYQRLQREYPSAAEAHRADAELARIYLALGQLELAAQHLEASPDAPGALRDAAAIRDALGDTAKGQADLSRLAASSEPAIAAEGHLQLAEVARSRDDKATASAELDRVLALGDSAGPARLLALARAGELRWNMSCPVPLTGGVCVDVSTFTAPSSKLPTACLASSRRVRVTLHPRASASTGVDEARAAALLYEQSKGAPGDDERQIIAAYSAAKLVDAGAGFEALLANAPPDPQRTTAEVETWFARRSKDAEAVRAKLELVDRLRNPEASLAGAARLGALEERLALDPGSLPMPEAIHANAAGIDAHCNRMETLAKPFRDKAIAAYSHCARAAALLGLTTQVGATCNAGLVRLDEPVVNLLPERLASPVLADVTVTAGEPLASARDLWRRLRSMPAGDPAREELAGKARAAVLDVLARGFDPRASALLGLLLADDHQLAAAHLVLDEAKRRAPKSPVLHAARGVVAVADHDSASALDELADAGDSPFARVDRGIVLLQQGRYDEAAAALADPLAPGSEYEQLVARGVAARGQGRFEDAERDYQLAIARDGERAEAYFAAGLLYKSFVSVAAKDPSDALKAYETANSYLQKARPRASKELAAEIDTHAADVVRVINQLHDFLNKHRD